MKKELKEHTDAELINICKNSLPENEASIEMMARLKTSIDKYNRRTPLIIAIGLAAILLGIYIVVSQTYQGLKDFNSKERMPHSMFFNKMS
ncbi:MAG: hypothetical protein HY202_03215 [Nitrospirae bacterium]|nr:hypothetical protein [Nitrospirota bacterium]